MKDEGGKEVARVFGNMADTSRAERGVLGREVPTGYPAGHVESKHVAAGKADKASTERRAKGKSKGGGGPLLTEIAPGKAELGMLMYDLPIKPWQKSIRAAEKKIITFFKRKEEEYTPAETNVTTENVSQSLEKRKVLKDLWLNFCKSHRQGHIEGLARVSQTDLLDTILANAKTNEGLDPKDLAYQAATTLEVAGQNEALRGQLVEKLKQSTFWKEKVVDSGVTNGLEIPGITDSDGEIFPGAKPFPMPEKVSTKVDSMMEPAFKMWTDYIAKNTAERAQAYIEESKPGIAVVTQLEAATESI